MHSTRYAAAAAKSLQSCLTLCDPIDSSPPGSPIPGSLQARTVGWVAISFYSAWKWKVKVKSVSHVRLLATPWTAAYQAPLSMGFSRQEYWSGVPLPSLNMLTVPIYTRFPCIFPFCLSNFHLPRPRPLTIKPFFFPLCSVDPTRICAPESRFSGFYIYCCTIPVHSSGYATRNH